MTTNNAKKTARNSNVTEENVADIAIKQWGTSEEKDNRAMLSFTGYLYANPANFGPAWVTKIDKTNGEDRTALVDRIMGELSPYYADLLATAKRIKDMKGEKSKTIILQSESIKLKQKAIRGQFERSVHSLKYLQSVNAVNIHVQSDGIVFQHEEKDAKGKKSMRFETLTGRTIAAFGKKLMTPKAPAKKKKDAGKPVTDAGITLKTAFDFTLRNMRNEKGALTPLSGENEMAATKLLVTLLERQFIRDGEVKTQDIAAFIKKNITGVMVDGLVERKTAKEAEKTLHKDAVKETATAGK